MRVLRRKSFAAGLSLLLLAALAPADSARKASAHLTPAGLKVSPDLLALTRNGISSSSSKASVSVVVQFAPAASSIIDTVLSNLGGRLTRRFKRLNARVVTLPLSAVGALASRDEVKFVSPVRSASASGHVTTTTGAEAVRLQKSISLLGVTTYTKLDGSGVGIAVIDSGVDANHAALAGSLGLSRVTYSQDFTGEGRTDDVYGHGTHVASIAAGSDQLSGGAYAGLAPNANVINLRVLDSRGQGTTSSLLGALDWVLANRTAYGIQVVNMSVGAPAVDSYKNDPVCQAARQLADAGVVIVAAAGNDGKDASGQKLYGTIHSPGDEPSAITVGAANTFQTDLRSDDGVTTYSSRGPSRGYWTDDAGVRHYDNLIKPDLVAPGNKIVAAAAPGNALLTAHPELAAGSAANPEQQMMTLSGTSMAAPVVAGAAALMLQANPSLTPNLVKMLLTTTAQPVAGYNNFEQGAGALNVDGAVRLAKITRRDLSSLTALGAPLLTTTAPAPSSTFASQTFCWSQGVVLRHATASGAELYTEYQRAYALGASLGDSAVESGTSEWADPTMLTGGVTLGTSVLTSDGTTLAGGTPFLDASMLLGDGIVMGDGILMGDGIVMGDGILMGDGIVMGDSVAGGS